MARRATESIEDAKFRLNGINNLERVFRGALAHICSHPQASSAANHPYYPTSKNTMIDGVPTLTYSPVNVNSPFKRFTRKTVTASLR